MKQKGFTLIELLVVISIIALLASIVLVSLNSARGKGRYAKVLADMAQIGKAAEMFNTSSTVGYPADNWPGLLPGELAAYISKWPTPPCNGWTYDWENWSSGNDIRVTARRSDNNEALHYCIYNPTGGCMPDLTQLAAKTITCN